MNVLKKIIHVPVMSAYRYRVKIWQENGHWITCSTSLKKVIDQSSVEDIVRYQLPWKTGRFHVECWDDNDDTSKFPITFVVVN